MTLKGQKQRIVLIDGDGIVKGEAASLFDVSGEHLVTIDSVHNHIHAGDAYSVSHAFLAVANTASVELLFRVNSVKDAHLVAEVESEGKAEFVLLEAPTTTDDGTPITPRNKFRAAASDPDQSDMSVFHAPTVTVEGIQLQTELILGGTGPQSIGAAGGRRAEWVLATNTDYVFRVTNNSGLAKDITIHLEWYEELIEGL